MTAAAEAVGIVGAGGFGTALAAVLGKAGREVLLFSTTRAVVEEITRERTNHVRLPGVRLSERVRITADAGELAARARFIVVAVASADVRERARVLGRVLDGRHLVVHAIGASSGPDDTRVTQVLQEETPVRRMGSLAGPALPPDLAAGRFAAMVCASPFDEVLREARRLLSAPPGLRVYTSRDLAGVEIAAALSGAYSVAIGLADSMDLGPGPRAVLVTRAVAEGQRLVAAQGGAEKTFAGLAGLGNLLVRTSPGSGEGAPGYQFGRALMKWRPEPGERLPDAVRAIGAGVRQAQRLGLRAPILGALHSVIEGKASAAEAARVLGDTVALEE
ncbi:MAG TPA: 2-dehydropantoate 2-reductase N-terminal domain-containing protein [Kofleriaceae bacterium]|nr:2-dehydropantoate 2-reductase N-terminal domain-containing protein [Kofleriaceae bacterium]